MLEKATDSMLTQLCIPHHTAEAATSSHGVSPVSTSQSGATPPRRDSRARACLAAPTRPTFVCSLQDGSVCLLCRAP